jgi:hypothetical protein
MNQQPSWAYAYCEKIQTNFVYFLIFLSRLQFWACDQGKGMERCGPKMQPKNHIYTLGNAKECVKE